jgi:hypothetical protein
MGHTSSLLSYILCSIVFVAILVWMFVYSARLKTRKATEEKFGRPPVSKEEGIAIATEQNKK